MEDLDVQVDQVGQVLQVETGVVAEEEVEEGAVVELGVEEAVEVVEAAVGEVVENLEVQEAEVGVVLEGVVEVAVVVAGEEVVVVDQEHQGDQEEATVEITTFITQKTLPYYSTLIP